MITSIPMKPLCVPIIVSLAFLVGCAKSSDVTALKTEIANLKESISTARNGAREKSDSLQGKCNELMQEVEKLKATNSELAAYVHTQAVSALADRSEVSNLGIQFKAAKMKIDSIDAVLDSMKPVEDERRVMGLEDRLKACEYDTVTFKARLDDIELHDKLQDMETENKFKQVKEIFQARDAEERMADLAFFRP